MWGQRRPNVVILEYFNCRWEGGEVGKVGKVGGWCVWEVGGWWVVRWETQSESKISTFCF